MGSINRQCPKCKHTISTVGGLARHKLYCKVAGIHYLNQQDDVYPTIRARADTHEDDEFTVEQWVYDLIATDTTVNDTSPTTTGNTDLILAEELSHTTPAEQPTSAETHSHAATSLSTSNIYCTQTYYEVTGRHAGTPFSYPEGNSNRQSAADRDHLLRPGQPADGMNEDNDIFYPFASSAEWAQVAWWVRNGTSAKEIDAWLRDPRIKNMRDGYISCRNAKEVKTKLHSISKGVSDKSWRITELDIYGKNLKIYHRDILSVVAFLIGHFPFKEDMVYSPIRQFNAKGDRVYDEAHSADRWWEIQDQLPDGATAIMVIPSSDQTKLTTLSGDKKAHPVYITILNILLKTRRAASRPAMLLLGYIPTDLPSDRMKKLDAYHQVMSIMFERKYLP